MTAQLTPPRPVVVSRTNGRKPSLGSYLWLVWRQHSSLVVWSVVATTAFCAALLMMQGVLNGLHCTPGYEGAPGPANQCWVIAEIHTMLYTWSIRLLEGVIFAPVVIGALWGAPLVAREYERGTQDLAWGQGISARRWLCGKLAALALLAIAVSLPLWLCARLVAGSMLRLAPDQLGEAFGWIPFATLSPLVVPYSLAALSVGVLASVVIRRTIPALVVVALVCVGLGWATADLARPHYVTPYTAHATLAFRVYGPPDASNALYLETFGFADKAGHEVTPHGLTCGSDEVACMRAAGIYGSLAVYQPSDREAELQWIEAGLTLLLAAGCTSLALWRLRPR